jgi:hypothetical protein
MAHETPVVASCVGGIPELINDGESGYLVERGDAEMMSQRVLELVNDAALRARVGQAARQTVEAKFDLKMRVAQLVESYGVVSEARPPERSASNQSSQIQNRATDARNTAAINPLLILEDKS